MHEARWTALVVLTMGISCGGRTPLYTNDDPAFNGLPANSDPGDRGSGDDNMGRGNSRGGQDDMTTGTGTGTGGPSVGSAGGSAAGGSDGVGGSSSSSGVGGSSSTGAGGSSAVACAGVTGEEMIDDMNDGNRFIPSVNGRAGAWTVYHDDTPMVTMHPDLTDPFTMDSTGDPCRRLAAHVYGGPFTVWGAGFGFGLGSPYNASAYTGLSFWGRTGAAPMSLQIAFPDKDTSVAGGLCDPGITGGNGCYDHFSARRPLNGQWQRFEIRFAELQQLGFGRRGQGFDATTLYEIQFLIPVGAKFDVWIDDVAFLTR